MFMYIRSFLYEPYFYSVGSYVVSDLLNTFLLIITFLFNLNAFCLFTSAQIDIDTWGFLIASLII